MNVLLLMVLTLTTACAGCDSKTNVFDPNGTAAVIAVDVAQAVLEEQKPAVNAAIAELPDDLQTLAQMAYGALQVFVNKLDEMQPKSLALQDPNTVNDTKELKMYAEDVKLQLDTLIH